MMTPPNYTEGMKGWDKQGEVMLLLRVLRESQASGLVQV